MLEIKGLNIQFGENIVFKDASFYGESGSLTAVVGKSGLGKSTFLHSILAPKRYGYLYQGEKIENEDQFIFDHVSTVEQIPAFIERLTVEEHIQFILETYSLDDNRKMLEALNLENLLNHYPKQLSGGEKTRVALYLALLKQPHILLADEPTASLDKENKEMVIHCLRQYAHEGHMVIVSTHDHALMETSDVIYTIQDQHLERQEIHSFNREKQAVAYTKNTGIFSKYIKRIRKHQTHYVKWVQGLLALSIGFVVFSFSINNFLNNKMNQNLNLLGNHEIIVYKPYHEALAYSFDGEEVPMEEEDYEKITNIEGVTGYLERYDACYEAWPSLYLDEESQYQFEHMADLNIDQMFQIKAFSNGYLVTTENISNLGLNLHLYDDKQDYRYRLLTVFDDEGVYISDELYHMLYMEMTPENPEITIKYPVPIYYSTNIADRRIDENSPYFPVYYVTVQYVEMKVPIRGVIDGRTLGNEDSMFSDHIYFSHDDIVPLIEEVQANYPDERICYDIMGVSGQTHFDVSMEDIDQNLDVQLVEQMKWTPDALTVYVDDIKNLNAIEEQLQSMGYATITSYTNTTTFSLLSTSHQSMVEIVGCLICGLFLVFYGYLKFINRKDEKALLRFLTLQGFNRQERKSFISQIWLNHALFVFIIATVFFFILRAFAEWMHIAFIQPNIKIIIAIFVLSILVEYVLPRIMMKE